MSASQLHGRPAPLPPGPAAEARSDNPEQTAAIAGQLAGLLMPGDLLLLQGDLGAGKTAFTQGLAKALGARSAVTSPTFVLVNIHPTEAGFDLVHADVYRLERLSEVADLGLAEMADDGSVVVVEWGDRVAAALPPDHLLIRFSVGPGEDQRTLRFVPVGPSWAERAGRLFDLGPG